MPAQTPTSPAPPTPKLHDYLLETGAHRLARRIEEYWRGQGYDRVSAWATPSANAAQAYYVVRSNLRCGLPPGPRRPDAPDAA